MTDKQKRRKIITLVRKLYIYRCQNKTKAEQKVYEALMAFCQAHNADFNANFSGARRYLISVNNTRYAHDSLNGVIRTITKENESQLAIKNHDGLSGI